MPTVTAIDLLSQRRLWRAISPEVQMSHPTTHSRVTLDENGSQIEISARCGRFWLMCGGVPVSFEKLDDAELVAVGILIEREGLQG